MDYPNWKITVTRQKMRTTNEYSSRDPACLHCAAAEIIGTLGRTVSASITNVTKHLCSQ